MIDTTGKCTACGQTVGIDTIHTCSPQVTAPTQGLSPAERRVGEARLTAEWVRVISEDGAVLGSWLAEGGTKLRSEVVESEAAKFLALDLLDARAAVARLTAEVERLKWEAVVWKSSLECWGRHHPWCWMVTQAGVEGVYCNCGYREALTGKDRSHEITPLSPHDAEQVRLFEERVRASITPETEEAARRFVAARDAFAASGGSLPTPAPEATDATS
jgi:hypothetical protein